jgi:hypothetical protein
MKVNLRSYMPALLACVGLFSLVAGTARADQLVPTDKPAGEAAPASDAKYGGVTPGSSTSNPLPQAPVSPPHLVWTGFQPTAGGSRVFLQTTAPVEFEVKEGRASKGGRSTLTVMLRGCRIHMANNRRRLDTRAFATPVQAISARQRRADIEVLITLREAANATSGSEAGPNGSRFVVLDFPPGKPAPIEERVPARAAASSSAGNLSGDGWAFSSADESALAEAKGKAKSRGKARAAASDQVPAGTTPRPDSDSASPSPNRAQ